MMSGNKPLKKRSDGRRVELEDIFREFSVRLKKHYLHAESKHPHFIHKFASHETLSSSVSELPTLRNELALASRQGKRESGHVLLCEICEMYEAYCHKDIPKAVEELLDVAAVLVRMFEHLQKELK